MNKLVGIVTFYKANNYGAVLQCYALSETIKQLGAEPRLIETPTLNTPKTLRERIRKALLDHSFSDFKANRLPKLALGETPNILVFGSDQIWNPDITKEASLFYLGEGISNDIAKISYAASAGGQVPQLSDERSIELLSKFSAISVRESGDQHALKHLLPNKTIDLVADPSLLLDSGSYTKLADNWNHEDNHLTVYLFNKNRRIYEDVNRIRKALRCESALLNEVKLYRGLRSIAYPSVGKWLSSIINSKYVITDSYHCMIFSILFRKNFVVSVANKSRISRVTSILEILGLKERLVDELKPENVLPLLSTDIDYKLVDQRISLLRNHSIKFLAAALANQYD